MKKSKQKTHLTPNEVAELLMVNPVTVRQWAARGLLRSLTTPGGHRRFLLSDVEEFARSRGATPVARHSGRPDRILIVDDDPNVSRLIAELIQERDDEVETEVARDGFEAGVKVESFRPHALVLDLMMPGIDGFEVCRRLRARPTLNHIRIVAGTGLPQQRERRPHPGRGSRCLSAEAARRRAAPDRARTGRAEERRVAPEAASVSCRVVALPGVSRMGASGVTLSR
jgi:excisionase family DNA binding protein